MPSKKESFTSIFSPIDIADPSNRTNRSGNLQADWERLSRQADVYVNDKRLSDYRDQYHQFEHEDDVRDFFEKEILKNTTLSDVNKAEAIHYLMTYLTQAGFMYPVSNILVYDITQKLGNLPREGTAGKTHTLMVNVPSDRGISEQNLHIVSNSTGFTIQEFVKISTLKATLDGKYEQPDIVADADSDTDYVIKAQGSLGFDFSDDATHPKIIVKSNMISYGNAFIEHSFGNTRTWYQRVLDFIVSILGLNTVTLIDDTRTLDDTRHGEGYDLIKDDSDSPGFRKQ